MIFTPDFYTRYEQETMVNYNAGEKTATVHTRDKVFSRDTFSDTSTQSVKDKLKRVILHDLEHGKQGRPRKSDEK